MFGCTSETEYTASRNTTIPNIDAAMQVKELHTPRKKYEKRRHFKQLTRSHCLLYIHLTSTNVYLFLFLNTVYIGFYDYGFSGQSGFSDR